MGVAEEDIRLQMQAVQNIVRAEVEKKVEKERMVEEKRRSEQMVREREEVEEKRIEQMEKIVRERQEEEREQNWAEKEQSILQALYETEREIEMEIGREDADTIAWEDEVERHFEEEMSLVCEQYDLWHERLVEEAQENRRIEEVEQDRNEMEYERDRMWMADELRNLDLEAKLKWIEDENEGTEKIGERWDRLGTTQTATAKW